MAKKRALYFEAGAEEVWICDEEGRISFYNEKGEIDASSRVSSFPRQLDV